MEFKISLWINNMFQRKFYFLPLFLFLYQFIHSQTIVLPDNWIFTIGDDPAYKNDPLRGIFTERENIKTELELLEEVVTAAHSLDEVVGLGRKKQEDDQKRTKKSTKTHRDKRQNLMKAILNEAKDILKSNKGLANQPYSIAAKIRERIKESRVKNKLLSQEKPSERTLARYIETSSKSL
jgi:hypothetical protein